MTWSTFLLHLACIMAGFSLAVMALNDEYRRVRRDHQALLKAYAELAEERRTTVAAREKFDRAEAELRDQLAMLTEPRVTIPLVRRTLQ